MAFFTAKQLSAELSKHGYPILEVSEPSFEEDGSVKITQNTHIQVGYNYFVVGRNSGDSFYFCRTRSTVAEVIADLRKTLKDEAKEAVKLSKAQALALALLYRGDKTVSAQSKKSLEIMEAKGLISGITPHAEWDDVKNYGYTRYSATLTDAGKDRAFLVGAVAKGGELSAYP